MKPFVIVLGIVFAIAGLGVGTNELHVEQNGETVSCGGAFGNEDAEAASSSRASSSLVAAFKRSR